MILEEKFRTFVFVTCIIITIDVLIIWNEVLYAVYVSGIINMF